MEKIREIKAKISHHKDAIRDLELELISRWGDILESRGIAKGTVVEVRNYSRSNRGIFDSVKLEFDKIRPLIFKITKSGKQHKTATLYCYEMSDIVGLEDLKE